MKDILLLVHDDAGQEARLQTALDLTRALDGHLICLDVVQMPVMVGEYIYGEADLIVDERVREADNRTRLESRLEREDVRWEMRQVVGDLAQCVTENAGLADLIVTSRRLDDWSSPEMRSVASSIVLKSGKPIVAVPEKCTGLDINARALIAWDGSPPAMAALAAAVPMLKHAQAVILFEAEDSRPPSVGGAARYLSRHGIHSIVRIVHMQTAPAELIGQVIAAEDAAYCVMGAYGHSRIGEALFGGVTRHMLGTSRVPLFLAR